MSVRDQYVAQLATDRRRGLEATYDKERNVARTSTIGAIGMIVVALLYWAYTTYNK